MIDADPRCDRLRDEVADLKAEVARLRARAERAERFRNDVRYAFVGAGASEVANRVWDLLRDFDPGLDVAPAVEGGRDD